MCGGVCIPLPQKETEQKHNTCENAKQSQKHHTHTPPPTRKKKLFTHSQISNVQWF